MRALVGLLFGLSILLPGCGGGGGNSAAPAGPPPPNPLYVRVNGNDLNSGESPEMALRTISKAAQIARSNYVIRVGTGTYREAVTTSSSGKTPQGLSFVVEDGAVVVSAFQVAAADTKHRTALAGDPRDGIAGMTTINAAIER